ncbi:hypothetical protein [Nonomuraea cavernae]|uniref:hypothetical protein n=1 Tax=Nonomuraea cavernae TaxID=2045107 RepID=UPI0033F1A970
MSFQAPPLSSPNAGNRESAAPTPAQPQKAEDQPHEEEKAGVLDVLEKVGSVVVPLGVTLYALLYIGYQGIYSFFGVTPEQAGIDQAVLLGRLLGTLVPLLIAGGLVVGLIVSLGWLLNVITRGWTGRVVQGSRQRPWIIAVIAAAWAGLSYLGYMYYLTALASNLDSKALELEALDLVIVIGLGVLAYVVPFRLLRRKPLGRAGLKVLVGALTGVGVGFALIIQMFMGTLQVLEKGETTALLDAVGFQTQWAKLQDSSGKPLYDSRWMMILGEREGGYAIYDCDKAITFRKFSESTILNELQTYSPDREAGFTCGSLAE